MRSGPFCCTIHIPKPYICETKGHASIHDCKNLELLYQPSYALDGNSIGTELVERMKKMLADSAERKTATAIATIDNSAVVNHQMDIL